MQWLLERMPVINPDLFSALFWVSWNAPPPTSIKQLPPTEEETRRETADSWVALTLLYIPSPQIMGQRVCSESGRSRPLLIWSWSYCPQQEDLMKVQTKNNEGTTCVVTLHLLLPLYDGEDGDEMNCLVCRSLD